MPTNSSLYPEDFSFAVEQEDLTLEFAIARLRIIARDTALRTMYAMRIAGQNESALQNHKFTNLAFHGKRLVNDDDYAPPPEPEDWTDILDAAIRVGKVEEVFRSTLPSHRWVWMVGQTLPRSSVSPELVAEFDALGEPYRGDGSTTIVIPDKRDRVGVGGRGEYALGQVGGAKTHTLTEAQIPEHLHALPPHGHPVNEQPHGHAAYVFASGGDAGNAGNNDGFRRSTNTAISGEDIGPKEYLFTNAQGIEIIRSAVTGLSVGPTGWIGTTYYGGGQPHNNMQPYLICNFIIKVL